MLSDRTINQVKDLDIETVLAKYGVKLKRKGANLFACCPFHSERTASFCVRPGRNFYYCHSCHRGGDAIKFVRDKEGCGFSEAVESIARACGVPVEYIRSEKSDEERRDAAHREALHAVIDNVQNYFAETLRTEMSDEGRAAREYAYGRWPEDFCASAGIGLAPKDSRALIDFCRRNALEEELLIELGILNKSKKGTLYTMFRNRLTIPVRDRRGRVIAFTARYLGDAAADGVGKYVNSSNSPLFEKSETVFGIDRASRERDADFMNIVEGGPDVLRMQSIGMANTVATLGTSWSAAQFDRLQKLTDNLCFIPDSDPPKGGKPFGPGFEAVMKNGAEAVRRGFDVTVRELPFRIQEVSVPMFDFEIEEAETAFLESKRLEMRRKGASKKTVDRLVLTPTDRQSIPRRRKIAEFRFKNDADDYIRDTDTYYSLKEEPFIVWLASKRLEAAATMAAERNCVAEIADLLRCVRNEGRRNDLISGLCRIHGKPRTWKDALKNAKSRAASLKSSGAADAKDERQKEIALLQEYNLTIKDNCYYTYEGDDEPTRLSNFILEPLFHIKDEKNGSRIYRMVNKFNEKEVVELRASEMNSLSAFSQKLESLGNYVWIAKADKLNKIKEYTYRKTQSAVKIRQLGWDRANRFFAFGNGLMHGADFSYADNLGIVHDIDGVNYYIPAASEMYADNPDLFQFEKSMVHRNTCPMSLHEFAERLESVFGPTSRVALAFLFATLFRDVIHKRTSHFPILYLFGEKGTGKTTLATCLQSFFVHGMEPPSISVTSVPAMNDTISQAVNTLVVFDEYRNDLDFRKIQFLKGMWGGAGQKKKNVNADGAPTQTVVTSGVAMCGQDKPTQDMALFTRIIFLEYSKTSFTSEESRRFDELRALCDMGLTRLALEVLAHRDHFEKHFAEVYSLTKSELKAKLEGEEIHDRVFGNWIIPLAAFRTLETLLDIPFHYADLFSLCIEGMRHQNEFARESSEVAEFWNTLQGLQSAGLCVEKAHFRIKYQRTFRPLSTEPGDAMEFSEARPILYLNAAAIQTLLNGNRGVAVNGNSSNWSTILSYLKSHNSYLGLKQDRFVILDAKGRPDYEYESSPTGGPATKKLKTTRPKALCFDYTRLKEAFDLNLETETVSEYEDSDDDSPVSEAGQRPASGNPFEDLNRNDNLFADF